MRAQQKENSNDNSDSVSENLALFGFLTPEKKRSRSASSPASKNVPISPRPKRTPITDRFLTSEHPIYLANQDEYNYLCEMLSQFEYNSIYPRRLYRFAFEKLEASLWQPMRAEFYHYINALVLGNDLPSLPDFIKIHEIKAEIKALFAGDPQNRIKKRHFKSHVKFFNDEILALQARLLPARFQFNLSLTNESEIAIAKAYLAKLSTIPSEYEQHRFLQIESNLEHLLITVNRTDVLIDLCLDDCNRAFWDNLVTHLHPEIIKFLMTNYLTTTDSIENIHPFHFISTLYDLHSDLSMMSAQLEKILSSTLADYLPENSREALLVLRSPFNLYHKKKTDELNSIRFLALVGNTAEFQAIPELDFHRPETVDSTFLNCIRQKTFSQHMRTIFSNYTRLINNYYDFTTLYAFAGAQQYVFDKVERLPGIDDSAPVNAYKHALTTLDETSQTVTSYRDNFTEKLNDLTAFMQYFVTNKIHNIVIAHELQYQQKDQCLLLWVSRVLDYMAQNSTCNDLDITEQQSFADTLQQHNIAIFRIFELTEKFRKQLELQMAQFDQIQCEDKFLPQLIQTGFQLLNAHMSKYEQKALYLSEDAAAICNSMKDLGMSLTDNISNQNQAPKLF